MKRIALAVALAVAMPLFANTALFGRYESVRQSFLKNNLKEVQTNAAALAADARKAKRANIAKEADAVAKSTDLNKARAAFATLSDAMITLRNDTKGAKPAVYGCSMLKKSWLQPKGQVGNPFDPAMAMCGELKAE